MLRKIIAVVVFELIWPGYAVHVREWMSQRIFTFTPPMAAANLVFWALGFCAAGRTTARIARDRTAVWVTAGLMQADAAYVHLYQDWLIIPWWYNLAVVCLVIPAAWCGARLGRRTSSA
jgi:hypothetical protein